MDAISTPCVFKNTNVEKKVVTMKEEPYDDDCVMYADMLHSISHSYLYQPYADDLALKPRNTRIP